MIAGSEPKITILEPVGNGREWQKSERTFDTPYLTDRDLTGLPKRCYIFLDARNYPPEDGRREGLLAHFNVPPFLATRTCFEINGYFGSKVRYDDSQRITSYSTWFRFLLKMVRKANDPHEDGPEYATGTKNYQWFETTFFTRWEGSESCQVLCVDTPPDFPDGVLEQLHRQNSPLDFKDPFALHASIVDQLIVHYDVSVWRVRDPVRQLEKTRMRAGAIFNPIHEMSRHAIHKSEVLEAAIETLKEMQRCRTEIHERMRSELDETHRDQCKQYGQFQVTILSNLKLRADSNQERLKDEIDLAFNTLSRQDNNIMTSITLLTILFFPATFVATFFSTTFFTFAEDGSWAMNDMHWLYWATTIPATIVVLSAWYLWLTYSDAILNFLEACWKRPLVMWTRATALKEKKVVEKA
ncbi:hypothetical protein VTK26DRAFT_9320 [Humicola hyalothermophila]